MKKQLKRLKGKRLVTGDANLMTKNEICINTTSDGGVEVKEIGTDGKIKDLANSGGGGSKEYDDLNTYLYYDDRIVSLEGMEIPLCTLVADIMMRLAQSYHNLNTIVKISNTEDLFGINYGNYIPLEKLAMNSSGIGQEVLLLINGISIPKYIIPELLTGSGLSDEIDKIPIFNFIDDITGAGYGDIFKTFPTITREEFFNLLK